MTPRRRCAAVFFDVDFTLIYPGPTFQGEGYERFCASARHRRRSVAVSPTPCARRRRSSTTQQEHVYDAEIFVRYTRRIIEEMGGPATALDACAREIYDEWAACQHF